MIITTSAGGCWVDGYSSTTDHATFTTTDPNILQGNNYNTVHTGSSVTQKCDSGKLLEENKFLEWITIIIILK